MQMCAVVKMNVEKKWLIYEVISTMPEMPVVKWNGDVDDDNVVWVRLDDRERAR